MILSLGRGRHERKYTFIPPRLIPPHSLSLFYLLFEVTLLVIRIGGRHRNRNQGHADSLFERNVVFKSNKDCNTRGFFISK